MNYLFSSSLYNNTKIVLLYKDEEKQVVIPNCQKQVLQERIQRGVCLYEATNQLYQILISKKRTI